MNSPTSARDRFVAFAFCWADVLVELDPSRRVIFAVGATKALLGVGPEAVIGKNFMDMVSPKDRVLVDQLLFMTSKKGRIDNVTIRLKSEKGLTPPVAFAGYVLPDLKDHFFLALRTQAHLDEKGETEQDVERDKSTGLLSGDSFSQMAVKKLKDNGAELTLVNLPGFQDFYNTLSEDEREVLLNTVGTTLRANSLGGDSAGEVGDGKFGIVHEAGLDIAALEAKLAEATKAFDPAGKGVEVQAATVEMDMTGVNEGDLAKGLVYTINHFKEQVGDKFNVKDIAANMDNLVKEAVQSLNNFRSLTSSNDFQIAFHPILDARTGSVHHYEALVRFNGKFEESPYKYITLPKRKPCTYSTPQSRTNSRPSLLSTISAMVSTSMVLHSVVSARRKARPLGAVWAFFTALPSSLTTSTSSTLRYWKLAAPAPKSSRQTWKPFLRRPCTKLLACTRSATRADSVISKNRKLRSQVSASISACRSLLYWSLPTDMPEMLTAMATLSARFLRSQSTHLRIMAMSNSVIRPVSSAKVMYL